MKLSPSTIAPLLVLAAACGGSSKPAPVTPPAPVVEARPTPPPPPPVCVPPTDPATISAATSDGTSVQFCTGGDEEVAGCFQVGLDDGQLAKLTEAPAPQQASLEAPSAEVETTPTEVKVCATIASGDQACTTLRPKVARGASSPIRAAVNASGKLMVAMLGDGERGKGYAEVWDVGKKKKLTTIKYGKGDYTCGVGSFVGDSLFISASVCAGPDARGALYSVKGKKLADVGSKDFGTYGTVPIQVEAARWAFLEEGGGAVALQDVSTGAVIRTVELVGLWTAGSEDGDALAGGNPGESALVRGGPGQLIAVAGSPRAGSVAVVTIDSGEVKVWPARACSGAPADAASTSDDDPPGDE
ncbi:MAG: hypothetical protein R3B06_30335 [Kofleriaceae bacterium]